MTLKQKFFFLGIVLIAIFFRFSGITSMPGGLFPDEAANGLDINLMQEGRLQPFYERGNGREALFFYLLWGSVELFGKGHWQHHIVSALVGVLAVIVCFAVARRLMLVGVRNGRDYPPEADVYYHATNIALLSSFLMAVSTWHIVLSRIAFRANLIPLFAGLTFYCLLATYQSRLLSPQRVKTYLLAFFTGAVFALGFYSYIAYRILIPVVAVLIIWPWFSSGLINGVKRWWKHFLIFIFSFLIFIWPLARYFYTHPGSFIGRSGQVSIFNPDIHKGDLIGVAGQVLWLSLKAYFTDGDLNWRHNISGFPFLSPLISPFFGAALVVITVLALWYAFAPKKRPGWWKYALLAGWFWGMLLPVVTTAEGIPHGLRAIGTIPPVFIISALGIYTFGRWIWQLHKTYAEGKPYFKTEKLLIDPAALPHNVLARGLMKVVVIGFIATLSAQSYFAYFVYAANSPENFYAFRSDLSVVARYLTQRCRKTDTYLVLDKFSVQTTDYLTSNWQGNFNHPCNVPYTQVEPESAWELSGLKPGDEIVFTQSSMFDAKKFKEYHPQAYLRMEVRNKFGQAVMAVYRIDR